LDQLIKEEGLKPLLGLKGNSMTFGDGKEWEQFLLEEQKYKKEVSGMDEEEKVVTPEVEEVETDVVDDRHKEETDVDTETVEE
jgi:hypothetical protein